MSDVPKKGGLKLERWLAERQFMWEREGVWRVWKDCSLEEQYEIRLQVLRGGVEVLDGE